MMAQYIGVALAVLPGVQAFSLDPDPMRDPSKKKKEEVSSHIFHIASCTEFGCCFGVGVEICQ